MWQGAAVSRGLRRWSEWTRERRRRRDLVKGALQLLSSKGSMVEKTVLQGCFGKLKAFVAQRKAHHAVLERCVRQWLNQRIGRFVRGWKLNAEAQALERRRRQAIIARWRAHKVAFAVRAWREAAQKSSREKRVMQAVLARWQHVKMGKTVRTWRHHAHQSKEHKAMLRGCLKTWASAREHQALRRWKDWARSRVALRHLGHEVIVRWQARATLHFLSRWRDVTALRRCARERVAHCVNVLQHAKVAKALRTWAVHSRSRVAARSRLLSFVFTWQNAGVARALRAWRMWSATRKGNRALLQRGAAAFRFSAGLAALRRWRSWARGRARTRGVMAHAVKRWQGKHQAFAIGRWREVAGERRRLRAVAGVVVSTLRHARVIRCLRRWQFNASARVFTKSIARNVTVAFQRHRELAALRKWRAFVAARVSSRRQIAECLRRWASNKELKALRTWRQRTHLRRHRRATAASVLQHWRGRALARAFLSWKTSVERAQDFAWRSVCIPGSLMGALLQRNMDGSVARLLARDGWRRADAGLRSPGFQPTSGALLPLCIELSDSCASQVYEVFSWYSGVQADSAAVAVQARKSEGIKLQQVECLVRDLSPPQSSHRGGGPGRDPYSHSPASLPSDLLQALFIAAALHCAKNKQSGAAAAAPVDISDETAATLAAPVDFSTFKALLGAIALATAMRHSVQAQPSASSRGQSVGAGEHGPPTPQLLQSLERHVRNYIQGHVLSRAKPFNNAAPLPGSAPGTPVSEGSRAGLNESKRAPSGTARRSAEGTRGSSTMQPFCLTQDLEDMLQLCHLCAPGLRLVFEHFASAGHLVLDTLASRAAAGSAPAPLSRGGVEGGQNTSQPHTGRCAPDRSQQSAVGAPALPWSATPTALARWVGWKRGHMDLGAMRRAFRVLDRNDDGMLRGEEVVSFIRSMVGRPDGEGSNLDGVGAVSDRTWAALVLGMAEGDHTWRQRSRPGMHLSGRALTFSQFVDAIVLLVNRQMGVLLVPSRASTPAASTPSTPGSLRSTMGAHSRADRRAALWREELFLIDVCGACLGVLEPDAGPVSRLALMDAATPSRQAPTPAPITSVVSASLSPAGAALSPGIASALLDAEVEAVLEGRDADAARRHVWAQYVAGRARHGPQAPLPSSEVAASLHLSAGSAPPRASLVQHPHVAAVSPLGPHSPSRRRQHTPRSAARPRREVHEALVEMDGSAIVLLPDAFIQSLRRLRVSQRELSRVDALRLYDWAFRTQCAEDAGCTQPGTPPCIGLRYAYFVAALAAVATHMKGRHPHRVNSLSRLHRMALLLARMHCPPPSTAAELVHAAPLGVNVHALCPPALLALNWFTVAPPPPSYSTTAPSEHRAAMRGAPGCVTTTNGTPVLGLQEWLAVSEAADLLPACPVPDLLLRAGAVQAQGGLGRNWQAVATAGGVPAPESSGPGAAGVSHTALAAALSPFARPADLVRTDSGVQPAPSTPVPQLQAAAGVVAQGHAQDVAQLHPHAAMQVAAAAPASLFLKLGGSGGGSVGDALQRSTAELRQEALLSRARAQSSPVTYALDLQQLPHEGGGASPELQRGGQSLALCTGGDGTEGRPGRGVVRQGSQAVGGARPAPGAVGRTRATDGWGRARAAMRVSFASKKRSGGKPRREKGIEAAAHHGVVTPWDEVHAAVTRRTPLRRGWK